MSTTEERCWICGGIANSEEHKFKSSDLRRNYGKRYSEDNRLLYFSDEKVISTSSYKAKEFKFPKVICINCNNNITKPHDLAYDQYVDYIENNYEKLANERQLKYSDVYGGEWRNGMRNLYKYFAKHAGCKIVTGKYPFNITGLSQFILDDHWPDNFVVHFRLNEGIKIFVEMIRANQERKFANLYNGPTIAFKRSNENECSFSGWLSYQWLSAFWIYCPGPVVKKQQSEFNYIDQIEFIPFHDCPPLNDIGQLAYIPEVIEKVRSSNLQEQYDYSISLIK